MLDSIYVCVAKEILEKIVQNYHFQVNIFNGAIIQIILTAEKDVIQLTKVFIGSTIQ